MSKKTITCFILLLAVLLGTAAAAEAYLVDAKIVTEVLDWGETVTGIRLEYSEEIRSNAITQNNEHPGKFTYLVIGDHEIDYINVNNTGVKADVEISGKYVFINFCVREHDWINYRDYITFNTTAKKRIQSEAIYFYQLEPIVTVKGNTIAPIGRTATKGEIREGIDSFTSFPFKSEYISPDIDFYYHLYIPEGYEEKDEALEDLPLVVHFPSGDATYDDYSGKYLGAIFSHNDVTEWVKPEAQEANPSFVLTYGATARPGNPELAKIYVEIINELIGKYNIDTSRIYGITLAGGSKALAPAISGHPDLFAAAIIICYDFTEEYDAPEAKAKFAQVFDTMPAWFIVTEDDYSGTSKVPGDKRYKNQRLLDTFNELNAEGYNINIAKDEDMWNGLLRGPKAEAQVEAQIERAKAQGADDLYTIILANTIRQTGHWAWTAIYTNAAVRGWLFDQVNDAPYVPQV